MNLIEYAANVFLSLRSWRMVNLVHSEKKEQIELQPTYIKSFNMSLLSENTKFSSNMSGEEYF